MCASTEHKGIPRVPGQNVLWFWYEDQTRRAMHGTVADAARKLFCFQENNFALDGLEIFLTPACLEAPSCWDKNFSRAFSALQYRTVHIGDTDENFLLGPSAAQDLFRLRHFLEKHAVERIILHANHLLKEQDTVSRLLNDTLPETEICVENTGFSQDHAASAQCMENILQSMPRCTMCLDIAHVQDFSHLALTDFIDNPVLRPRIAEVHFSLSTQQFRQAGRNLYAERGYPGEAPFHALYTIAQQIPDEETRSFIRNIPVVVEGIVPPEDSHLQFLRAELELIDADPSLSAC